MRFFAEEMGKCGVSERMMPFWGMWADIVLELPMMNRRNYLTLIGETIYEVSTEL